MRKITMIRAVVCALVALPAGLGIEACGSGGGSSATTATQASGSRTETSGSRTAAAKVESSTGATVAVLAHGVPTPTSITVGAGTVFVGAGGSEEGTKRRGGVFALDDGRARLLAHSPAVVYGLTFQAGALYVAAGPEILRWSGWNGARFTTRKLLFRAPRGFDGFNGLAFGPDGRIYSGVTLNDKDDHVRSSAPYGQSVVSLNPRGGGLKVVATGLREPFQLTFVSGRPDPYVTVLGQDDLGTGEPPDYIVRAQPGQRYGFPVCNWSKAAACARYAKPLVLLPAHASPMGIGAISQTLYVALFGGTGHGPEVASLSAAGGALKPLLTGFTQPPIALGVSAGTVYVGDLGGTVYSVPVGTGVNTSS